MKFIDEIEIRVAAGDGGGGVVSFRTARNKPKLGPDGGNGGNGGNVILTCKGDQSTLSSLRYKQCYAADPGGKGGHNNRTGKCGEHKEIFVPKGTVIYDAGNNEKLWESLEDGDYYIVAKGGKRGYGNLSYVTPTRRAPRVSTPGGKGEKKSLKLNLKLIADVGFAGFPNAGKSTLLSKISAAKPKIADYPFTTLVPQLGIVDLAEHGIDSSFVAADIPGLIEGASEGKGLGIKFLKHLERTKLIVYVIDASEPEAIPKTFASLQKELSNFQTDLTVKGGVIAFSKMDILSDEDKQKVESMVPLGMTAIPISSVTGEGIKSLLIAVNDLNQELSEQIQNQEDELAISNSRVLERQGIINEEQIEA